MMEIANIGLLSAFLACAQVIDSSILSGKIIRGEAVPAGKMTFIVSVRDIKSHLHVCGGSLISDQAVLTTAYCIMSFIQRFIMSHKVQPNDKFVMVGSHHLYKNGIRHDIVFGDIPDTYEGDHFDNIGIATLKDKIKESPDVSIVPYGEVDLIKNTFVEVAGWGAPITWNIYGRQPFPSNTLKMTTFRVVRDDRCERIYDTILHLTHFCTFPLNNTENISVGDAGSPVLYMGQVTGIVSHGNLARTGFPVVNTRVMQFDNFIKSVINKRNADLKRLEQAVSSNRNEDENKCANGEENEDEVKIQIEDEEAFIAEGRKRKGKLPMENGEDDSLEEPLLSRHRFYI